MSQTAEPHVPDYAGACIANVMPQVMNKLAGRPMASWMPASLESAKQIVLLVLDGLGWEQLQSHANVAPTLVGFDGAAITSVAPSSTPTGLTSIATGTRPSEHGVLGYRLMAPTGGLLNVISWKIDGEDARELVVPAEFQKEPAFCGGDAAAVLESRHLDTGFTDAFTRGARFAGYVTPSGLPVEVWRLAQAGEKLIYAYYGGIDAVAHAHGMGEHYDAELYTADRLIRDLLAGLPEGTALLVTSDHGQVQVGSRNLDIDADIVELCDAFSGEGRFRWLHAKDDPAKLLDMCRERFGELAWVRSREEIERDQWFGGSLSPEFAKRIGDVALVASAAVAFKDPQHGGERNMVSRHGSLTDDEMLVPLLARVV